MINQNIKQQKQSNRIHTQSNPNRSSLRDIQSSKGHFNKIIQFTQYPQQISFSEYLQRKQSLPQNKILTQREKIKSSSPQNEVQLSSLVISKSPQSIQLHNKVFQKINNAIIKGPHNEQFFIKYQKSQLLEKYDQVFRMTKQLPMIKPEIIKNKPLSSQKNRREHLSEQVIKLKSSHFIQYQQSPKRNVCNSTDRLQLFSTLYEKIGGDETVQKFMELHNQSILIFEKFQKLGDLQGFSMQFKTYLEYILGKPVFFNLQTLHEKHKQLKVRSREFNQFKFLMLENFIKVNKGDPTMIYEFSSLIEQFRYIIVNKDRIFRQVYNQNTEMSGNLDTIYLIAKETYNKIFKDSTLSIYFRGILIKEQAVKFSKILRQMMSWNVKSQEAVLKILRTSHAQMNLTNIHFVLFKQHLVTTFREVGLKEKQIAQVTLRMDGYKYCIINQDSLIDYVEKIPEGPNYFIRKYQKFLFHDYHLVNLVKKTKKRNFIKNHAHLIYYYIAHQNRPLLIPNDLKCFHHKHNISENEFSAFRDTFIMLSLNIGVSEFQMQDIRDSWDRMKQYILNQPTIMQSIGSKELVENLWYRVGSRLEGNQTYNTYFQNFETQIKFHIKRILQFILNNSYIFKMNDLKIIHQGLGITEYAFDLFVLVIKTELEESGVRQEVISKIESNCQHYKQFICQPLQEHQKLKTEK